MRKFTGYIRIGLSGAKKVFTFEVDDDDSQESVEEIAQETAFQFVEWDFHEDTQP